MKLSIRQRVIREADQMEIVTIRGINERLPGRESPTSREITTFLRFGGYVPDNGRWVKQ